MSGNVGYKKAFVKGPLTTLPDWVAEQLAERLSEDAIKLLMSAVEKHADWRIKRAAEYALAEPTYREKLSFLRELAK